MASTVLSVNLYGHAAAPQKRFGTAHKAWTAAMNLPVAGVECKPGASPYSHQTHTHWSCLNSAQRLLTCCLRQRPQGCGMQSGTAFQKML